MDQEVERESLSSAGYPECLLASADPELAERVARVLSAHAAPVHTVRTADALLEGWAKAPQALVVVDTRLPGEGIGQLLAAMRARDAFAMSSIVLFSDSVTEELRQRVAEGVVSDVLPLSIEDDFLVLRVEQAAAAARRAVELVGLRERAACQAVIDPLTDVYNRSGLMPLLFRETDRVQRMKTPLCMVLLDIDDFGHWNERLGSKACDELLAMTAERLRKLLRSYDLLGRVSGDEFLAALPGCCPASAMTLAERIREEVFATPFGLSGRDIRLTACFAVAPSLGRSPVVVLRQLERGMAAAQRRGPDTIRMATGWSRESGASPELPEAISQKRTLAGPKLLAD